MIIKVIKTLGRLVDNIGWLIFGRWANLLRGKINLNKVSQKWKSHGKDVGEGSSLCSPGPIFLARGTKGPRFPWSYVPLSGNKGPLFGKSGEHWTL